MASRRRHGHVQRARRPPTWPSDPPLTPISTLSTLVVTPPWNYSLTEPRGDLRESLERFLVRPLSSRIPDRGLGGIGDLSDVHTNTSVTANLERVLQDLIGVCAERGVPLPIRLIVATKLVTLGAHHITAAHVLHVRDEPFYQATALTLTRSAIELVARGGWVALGSGDEARRVVEGPRLPSPEQRREAQVSATTCLTAIENEVRERWRQADPPLLVYQWLCRFTHFDGSVVDLIADRGEALRGDAYAGTAYVGWLAAAVGEILMGQRYGRPPRLPDPPPWRR